MNPNQNRGEMTNTQDLIKFAAVEIMGWTTRVLEETNQFCYGEGVNPWSLRMNFDDWNPITNSNHLDMVRDRLVDLGFYIREFIKKGDYYVEIQIEEEVEQGSDYWMEWFDVADERTDDKDKYNQTRLTVYYEAFKKWSELK